MQTSNKPSNQFATRGHEAIDELVGRESDEDLIKEVSEGLAAGEQWEDDKKEAVVKADEKAQESVTEDDTQAKQTDEHLAQAEKDAKEKAEAAEKAGDTDLQTKYENLQKALKAERTARQHSEQRTAALEKRSERFEKIAAMIEDSQKKQFSEQDEESFVENPALYLKKNMEKLREDMQQTREQDRASSEQEHAINAIAYSAQQFAQQQPDYMQAMEHAKNARFAEYELYGLTPDQYESEWAKECTIFGMTQLRMGKNPAEAAYQYAKIRGYTANTENQDTISGQKAKAADTNKTRLQNMKDGKRAAGTLEGGGEGTDDVTTISSIDNMTDEEFDEFFNKLSKQARRR